MLSAQFFSGNRESLLSLVDDSSLIVLAANGLMQRSGDTVYSFRQDSNFYYLTGVTEPDLLLVLDARTRSEFIVLSKRTQAEEIFGGIINCDEIAERSGVATILEYEDGWRQLKELQQNRKKLYTILPPPLKVTHTDNFFTNGNRRQLVQKLKRSHSSAELVDVRELLVGLRQIKQSEEVQAIKKAIAITALGISRAKEVLHVGSNAFKLRAELDYVFAQHGEEHAFSPIVSSGPDTCVLHIAKSPRDIAKTEPVLFDIGAQSELYSADVSRTYFSTTPSPRQYAVFEAVKRVHGYAISTIKPGLKWKEYMRAIDYKMGEELMALGLISENNRNAVRRYFPHAVSHSLGLDTHDPCNYAGTIEEGMVITVEPGIYINEESLGIRIEDDILVTKSGNQNLSAAIPLE